jgi:hypothetical protein
MQLCRKCFNILQILTRFQFLVALIDWKHIYLSRVENTPLDDPIYSLVYIILIIGHKINARDELSLDQIKILSQSFSAHFNIIHKS